MIPEGVDGWNGGFCIKEATGTGMFTLLVEYKKGSSSL